MYNDENIFHVGVTQKKNKPLICEVPKGMSNRHAANAYVTVVRRLFLQRGPLHLQTLLYVNYGLNRFLRPIFFLSRKCYLEKRCRRKSGFPTTGDVN